MTEKRFNDPDSRAETYLSGMRNDVKTVLMVQHASVLREYARKVIVDGEQLSEDENKDRQTRMMEFLAMGKSIDLTSSQLVKLLCRGLLDN